MLEIGFSHELYAPHFPECEDLEGYYCKPCHRFIEAGLTSRNWCECCGLFAGKVTECICREIEEGGF